MLVPKHEVLADKEADGILEHYDVSRAEMPRIKEDDPAIDNLGAKRGDIIRIRRINPRVGVVYYYRVVI